MNHVSDTGHCCWMHPVSLFLKENVLRIIDCMSMLKLNTLHFHLTDDNGWRVEIKKYPRLTEVGAWRVDHQDLPFPARRNPKKGEPTLGRRLLYPRGHPGNGGLCC